MSVEEYDRVAVQRDAMLVHALATRTLPAEEVDIHDPIVGYLASWVDWVDAGVDEHAVFDVTMGKDRVSAARAKRHNRAALIAGSTVAALLVSSGAAAAVTGDPFLVAKAPLRVLEHVNPFDGSSDGDTDRDSRENLPPQVSDAAQANKLLADAQRAAARGHTHKAERLVNEVRALLGDGANPGQQNRIDNLVDDIATGDEGQSGDHGLGEGPGDPGQPADPGNGKGQGTGPGTNQGKGPGTNGQKDDPSDTGQTGKGHSKDPVDKDPKGTPGGSSSGNGPGGDPGSSGGGQGKGKGSGERDSKPEHPKTGKGSGEASGKKSEHSSSGSSGSTDSTDSTDENGR